MTINEFLPYVKDILGPEVGPNKFDTVTEGTAMFAITVARGNKPKDERAIINASYLMAINAHSAPEIIDFIGLTDRGRATLRSIRPDHLETNGTVALYHASPLPVGDPREGRHWTAWPKVYEPTE